MKKSILFLISLLGFICCFSVLAEETTITQKNASVTNLGLYGSHTWDIAVDPTDNNYIYLATYYSPNGFFRSADNGQTWKGLPNDVDHGAGRAVEVNPSNGHVYALLGDLLVSTDHGDTYTVAHEFGANSWSLLYAQDALFVGTSEGEVYKTSDEGANFSAITVCASKAIWSLASAGDAFYALCYDYDTELSTLFTSIDGGASWTDLEIASDNVSGAEQIAINPVTDHIFLIPSSLGGDTYISTDAGSTWTALTGAPNAGHMAFDTTGRVYVGWYYSDDEGDNWTSFGTGGNYSHIMMPDPTNNNILYDTSVPGFSKSTDQGLTWTDSVENITAVEVTAISQAADKNYVWVATQNGPAVSSDFLSDNPTWQYMPISENFLSSGYDAVWVNPDDTNYVVASSSQALHYSVDGGLTWTAATVDITLTGAIFQIVNDADNNLYAVVGPNVSTGSPTGGVIKSVDNGATWTSLNFPNNSAARSIAAANDGNIYVGAHSSLGGVYKFNGSGWKKLDVPDDYEYMAIIVDPQDVNTIYALARNAGVYKSADKGETWKQKNEGLGDVDDEFYEFNALSIQTSTDPNSLYLSGVKNGTLKGVIYKSSDGAENWNKLYTGKSGETFNTLLFDGLAAGNSRGIYNLKSHANLILKRLGSTLRINLKDAATERKLKHRTIKVYKKKNQQWQFWKKVKTNIKGNASLSINFARTTSLKAVWSPHGTFADEYTKAIKTKKINI